MVSWPPKKNTAFTFYVGLISQADTKLLQANPTLAAGDVKVAVDDAAPANLGTLPVVDADFTDRVKVVMTAGEMNGDRISVIFSDAAGAEWADLFMDIPTSVRQIDDLSFPTTSGRSTDVLATGEIPIDFDTSIGTLAAAQIEASALDGKGDWNIGKTGYSLTQAFPTNFADLSIVITTGLVDITQAAADKVWSTAARTLTAFSTALALNVWHVLESAIVTASTIGLKLKNNLDVVLSTRATPAQVNTEVDNALNTAIPGGPTADSINQRILAVDDLTQAAGGGDLASILTIVGDTLPKKNTALNNVQFLMVLSSDHVSASTGLTVTLTRSIDAGAFGAKDAGTTITEVANGMYQVDFAAADTNGTIIVYRCTGAASDDTFFSIRFRS